MSILRRIQDAAQPLLAKINMFEDRLQGIGSTPRNKGKDGAAIRSGKESGPGIPNKILQKKRKLFQKPKGGERNGGNF